MKKIILSSIIAIVGYTQIQTSEIRFKPADQFAAPGTNGIYYKDLQAARIENPSSGLLYEFTDVVSGGTNGPAGLIKVGSYTYSAPAVNGIKRGGVRLINIYGILIERQDALQAERPMPGSNSNTYAPIVFTPADETPGMIGNYFVSSHIATIRNQNSSEDQASRLFTNVIATNDREIPEGYQPIGFYSEQPAESMASFAQLRTYLYGQEQIN